jgi:hypothetical protein
VLALEPLLRRRWDAATLVHDHPPVRLTARKQAVLAHACPPGRPAGGVLEVTRWGAGLLDDCLPSTGTVFEVVPGWFRYGPPDDPAIPEWHLNFASSVAFSTYGLALFAQDEMQVLEHPALMSLHEALVAERHLPRTVEHGGRPTPVLVRGVERRCAIDTAPDAAAGRPRGLYGNEFERAPVQAILEATRVLDPPPRSRILAIEAPALGFGRYRDDEIAFVLQTAWAGFAAARAVDDGRPVVIHSGYWGCGAYGGNRVLMVLLQCLAADAAGIGRLVLHAGSEEADALEGVASAESIRARAGASVVTDEAIRRAVHMGFRWGVGNGT